MMSDDTNDLLEQLRTRHVKLGFNEVTESLFSAAADEIERLHAEKRQLRKALGKITTLHWFAVPAEIARAALGEEKK
jgi:hypothetical protein